MADFWLWFSTGVEHITDLGGYDHILFVALLTISYSFKAWKPLLYLITAFTVGHSIALAISVTTPLNIKTEFVEFLIALSILLTAIYQMWCLLKRKQTKHKYMYAVVLCFGLVHGLGFSYLLKAMLGKEESVAMPLLYFNLGLEVGQLLIVLGVLLLNWIAGYIKTKGYIMYQWIFISIIFIVALQMCMERIVGLF